MRNMEFKMERQGLLTVGQEVDVTEKMMEYLKPLIHGETEIIYENGIPKHLYLY